MEVGRPVLEGGASARCVANRTRSMDATFRRGAAFRHVPPRGRLHPQAAMPGGAVHMADEENHVLVNGLSPVTRKSGGRVVGFPDVCRTPSPGGPVPIPYPNSAESKALEKGSRTVSINGAPVCLASSRLGTSTGDEAGTAGGGVSSGRTGGAAHPVNYSFDVRMEGNPVVRNLDLFTLNDRNTAPLRTPLQGCS